jgi:hypothetical protein
MNASKHSVLQKAVATVTLLMVLSIAAFATPTALTVQTLIQNNAAVTAGQLAITQAACDNVNGNSYSATGREILFLQNTDSSTHTVTITPVVDPYGGTNTTLTTYSLAATGSAGSLSMVQMKFLVGWATSGTINITCSSNLIKIAVVQYN